MMLPLDNDLTLNSAQQEDEKKLGEKPKVPREKPSSTDEDCPVGLGRLSRIHSYTSGHYQRLSFNEGKSDDQIVKH